AACERSADDRPALAMVFRLLAVEGERVVVVVMLGECRRREHDERNTLVGRTEQHVELEVEARDRGRVAARELRGCIAAVEQAGIEKVGTDAARLEREFAESQNAELEGQFQELCLVRFHGIKSGTRSVSYRFLDSDRLGFRCES